MAAISTDAHRVDRIPAYSHSIVPGVYPGDMATGISQGLASDPKAVEKDLAKYLPA